MDFETALSAYIERVQELQNAHYAQYEGRLTPPLIVAERGKRFVRIVKVEQGISSGRSVHSFVDTKDGAVLKAASWKKPETKNPRGNIYNPDPVDGVTAHGAKYLR